MPLTHIQEHIDVIARHEAEFLAQRTWSERLGDTIATFAGSFPFVLIHLAVFALWMAVNIWPVPGIPRFDPPPFSLLGTLVALEAILLASFILMRQSRTAKRSDERDHLMLQILLLTEKEMTASLDVQRQLARKLGLDTVANNPELRELSQHTSIEDVAEIIRESLPEAEQ